MGVEMFTKNQQTPKVEKSIDEAAKPTNYMHRSKGGKSLSLHAPLVKASFSRGSRHYPERRKGRGPLRAIAISQSILIAIFSFSIPTCACKLSARVHLVREAAAAID